MEQTIRVLPALEFPSGITNRDRNFQSSAFSIQRSKLYKEIFSPDQLSHAFNNFKKSDVPSRFLLFSADTWIDIAYKVFDDLTEGFSAGKTALEVTTDQTFYLFDFLRMVRINLDTGKKNSIAWIDVHGRCFFPKSAVDEEDDSLQPMLSCNMDKSSSQLHRLPTKAQNSESCGENMEVSSDRWPGTNTLCDDDKCYKLVERLFLSGIKRFIPNIVITSINRFTHSSPAGKSRHSSFKSIAAESRGNASVKFGWYGASRCDIAEIISDGFRRIDDDRLGFASHDTGVHLSPAHYPYVSALMAEADDDGERHVILCRVITENSQEAKEGTMKNHINNSPVDDAQNSKLFVVPRRHMNTHINPEYIVSFKFSSQNRGRTKPEFEKKMTPVRNFYFWRLFGEIAMSLPASKMQALEIYYSQYKVKKISKEMFIRKMRFIAGDKLLISSIKSLKG